MVVKRTFLAAEAFAGQFDPVGVVQEAIEDRVGDSWFAEILVPDFDRKLAGDNRRTQRVAILDQFEKVVFFGVGKRFETEVVEDEKFSFSETEESFAERTVAAREPEGFEQTRNSLIANRETKAAGGVAERASDP